MSVRKSRRKRPVEDEAFIDMLAFASVMTILLAFFIMLSSYAGHPKEESAEEALDSVKDALGNFGVRQVVFGRSDAITNLNFKVDHNTGKYKKRNQLIRNELANTIDEKVDIEYLQKGHQVIFPTEINFINKELDMSPESKLYLNNLIKLIKDRDCQVVVGGYAGSDFVPSDEYPTSWQLSAEYASAVTRYFNDVGNIDYKRLTAIGYGTYQPLLSEEMSFNTRAHNRINIIISDK